jgi:hypothetical protein
MTYTIEMRRSPDITEEEVRRRLAACYSLLLELAEKHKRDALGEDGEAQPDAPGDPSRTQCDEPADGRAGPGEEDRMHPGNLADDAASH